jgi:anti-sigma regulatory factor (Ser/Thr protein kinase)
MAISKYIIIHCAQVHLHQRLMQYLQQIQQENALPFPITLVDCSNDNDCRKKIQQIEQMQQPSPGVPLQCLAFIQCKPADYPSIHSTMHKQLGSNVNLQTVLLTDSTDDYLELALTYNIGNFLRNGHFDVTILTAILKRLLGSSFFGFSPFFPHGTPVFHNIYHLKGTVSVYTAARDIFATFLTQLPPQEQPLFETFLSELLTNALVYGTNQVSHEERDTQSFTLPPSVFTIPQEKEIMVTLVQDEEKYGISVIDRYGELSGKRILHKIRRHTPLDHQPLPPGLEDSGGRGFFILSSSNRMVVNILKGIMTEVILLHYFDAAKNHYQPLIINEKE